MKKLLPIVGILTLSIFLLSGCGNKTTQSKAAKFVAKNKQYCKDKPIKDKKDRDVFPIIPQYEHIPKLGQLFTANHCGEERLNSIPGVVDKQYTQGSVLWLNNNPSGEMVTALTDANFICSGGSIGTCKKWRQTDESIPIKKLLSLEKFITFIADDDCINCK